MNAQRFMTNPKVRVGPNETMVSARIKLASSTDPFLAVVDPNGRLLGLLHRDMVMQPDLDDAFCGPTSVRQFMSRRVPSCRPADPIESVLATFDSCQAEMLVVTDDAGQLEGLIARNDIPLFRDSIAT